MLTQTDQAIEQRKKPASSCRKSLQYYTLNPNGRFMRSWYIMIGLFNLSAYILDPLVLVFEFKLLRYEFINIFSKISTFLFVINMLMVPFTATLKVDEMVKDDTTEKIFNASISAMEKS